MVQVLWALELVSDDDLGYNLTKAFARYETGPSQNLTLYLA